MKQTFLSCKSGNPVYLSLLLLMAGIIAWHTGTAQQLPAATIKTGGVQMVSITTPKGNFNVWTKRVGNNPKIKVLLLAGGPGVSHEYLECFESFFPKEGIEFIYYDQLGCGYSDKPNDTALYSLSRSVDELEQVRKALHLDKENLILWGHSWGGILAMQYALKYQSHLKALIISNMVSNMKVYNSYASDVLEKQIPASALDSIRQYETRGEFTNPAYEALMFQHYFAQVVCRIPVPEWPEPFVRAFRGINREYGDYMVGPDQFVISGQLATWHVDDQLPQLTVPTLTIGARYDYMNPGHMQWMATQVKNGSFLYCPGGSHLCFYDDQKTYMDGLLKYIHGIANGQKKVAL
ncbi:proline iminopeptidase-family hydrolase [Deminuibacter soli]|uniref:Alpha/beta fold hydrolase n=1 Tax=Deminuibacter soli TaxID=2291815 RepID=A0A3E1NGL1_9BACT|nr:proline iminopeptidase-family hydrolase [Deminuibacter soli]RFM26964.1 alpha/beta fold hydrolase [Deminuibacter soli]